MKRTRLLDSLRAQYKELLDGLSWYEWSKYMCTHLDDFSDEHIAIYFFGDADDSIENNLKHHDEIIKERRMELEEFKIELIDKYRLKSNEIDFVLYG